MRVVLIIRGQCITGNGYKGALSEAHEQAVVKAAGREFIFEMQMVLCDFLLNL